VRGGWLMPGLPLAATAVVCPAAAALALSWRRGGAPAALRRLLRAVDGRRMTAAWWAPTLLISPAVSVAAYLILRHADVPVPAPQIAVLPALGLVAVFLPGALAEELGWTGFALEPLQARLGWLGAALAIGAVWAVWHVPALLQAHRSAAWIGWWALGTLATRVIMVWLFARGGRSVFGAAVFHAVGNLCWQLFPVRGSWFDPQLNGLLLAILAAFAAFDLALRRNRGGRLATKAPGRPPGAP